MYKRAEYHTIKSRLESARQFIQVVTGSRQVGKTTVVKQVLRDLDLPWLFYAADDVPATGRAWISNCRAAAAFCCKKDCRSSWSAALRKSA